MRADAFCVTRLNPVGGVGRTEKREVRKGEKGCRHGLDLLQKDGRKKAYKRGPDTSGEGGWGRGEVVRSLSV